MKKIAYSIFLLIFISHISVEQVFSQVSLADSLLKNQSDTTALLADSLPKKIGKKLIHPYKIRLGLTIGIAVSGTVGNYFAIPRILGKKKITDAELANLNPDILTRFDKWALYQNSSKREMHDKLSDQVITGIFILPVALVFDRNIRHDGLKLLLMYYESQAITFSIFNYSFLGPTFQNKFRPMAYYTDIPVDDRNIGNNRNSFFAGHVSSATAASFFMVKVYCDYHPEIGAKKYLLYTAAIIPALTMGYLRVLALKHFPSDILAGITIGAVCGIAIPALHRIKNKNVNVGFFASPEGAAGLSMNWNMKRLSAKPDPLNKIICFSEK